MEFGKHAPPHASALSSSGRRAPPPQQPPQPKAQSEEAALHEAIGAEIEERRAFLEDMRACGRGKEHEGPITAQIAERVEELKTLERLMKN